MKPTLTINNLLLFIDAAGNAAIGADKQAILSARENLRKRHQLFTQREYNFINAYDLIYLLVEGVRFDISTSINNDDPSAYLSAFADILGALSNLIK